MLVSSRLRDGELLALYPEGGMIYLCGSHARFAPIWRAMPSVRSLQLNDRAAEDLAAYFEGLREDQVLYVMPTARMTVEEILRITGGQRLVLQCALPEGLHSIGQ